MTDPDGLTANGVRQGLFAAGTLFRGLAGSIIAGLPGLLRFIDLPPGASCWLMVIVWAAFTVLIAHYIFQNTQCAKAILLPVIVRDSRVEHVLMKGYGAAVVALVVGGFFGFSLLVAMVAASGTFLAGAVAVGVPVAVVARWLGTVRYRFLRRQAAWLATRMTLTGLTVAMLVLLQVLVYRYDPRYENYGTLDQPEEYVIAHVHHDCETLQDVVRTLAYIEVTVWGLRHIEGFGTTLFVLVFGLMFSVAPFLAWTMVARTVVELPLGLARYPSGPESAMNDR
jgi:hypothetical protein